MVIALLCSPAHPDGSVLREAARVSGLDPEVLAQAIGVPVAEAEKWKYSEIPVVARNFFEELLLYCLGYFDAELRLGSAPMAEVLLSGGTPSILQRVWVLAYERAHPHRCDQYNHIWDRGYEHPC
jgi:hypothetical protein